MNRLFFHSLVNIFFLFSFVPAADAKTFQKIWLNLNYVPCENMGITGSGTVELTLNYTFLPAVAGGPTGSAPAIQDIASIFVSPKYPHESDVVGTLKYTNVLNQRQTMSLVKPWYPTIGERDSNQLVMPKFAGTLNLPPQTQQAQIILAGTPLTLNLNIRFAQDGGNCFASFEQTFTLP